MRSCRPVTRASARSWVRYRPAGGRTLRGVPDDLLEDDAPLTAEDILTFGPVVEAQVWTPTFIAEARAPIAVAAGKPKFGPVFNSDGMGKAVLIRPCVSRGKRIRGLPPIYTPKMLEGNAGVFAGWPMYLDHVPPELAEAAAKRGRSVKELGGQVVTPFWQNGFVQEYDADFGYQPGGVLAEIWATPYLRSLVGENPNLLHTSIAAWPTSGKPSKVPWNPKVKGMAIEGIRRQPQGSVDFVPRGGAGGRLLLSEGEDPDTSAWPEPQWEPQDRALVVSLAEAFYASPAMGAETTTATQPDFSQMTPEAFRQWVSENASHLTGTLAESETSAATASTATTPGLTIEDVRRVVQEATQGLPTTADIEQTLTERLDSTNREREEQRELSRIAERLIESAEGIPTSWKSDLKARYAMLPSGPSPALLVESDQDDDGNDLSEADVLRRNVQADLDHARELIAEATGKPRVKGEGGTTAKNVGDERTQVREGKVPYWRTQFAEMGIVESEDKALSVHGVEKVEG
jgi:hypothetical protein